MPGLESGVTTAAFAALLASFFSRFVSLGGTEGRVRAAAKSISESDSKPSIWSSWKVSFVS